MAPLAAISLLAAAAAVAINPVLINVSLTGKRKKRSSRVDEGEWNPEMQEKVHELKVSKCFAFFCFCFQKGNGPGLLLSLSLITPYTTIGY